MTFFMPPKGSRNKQPLSAQKENNLFWSLIWYILHCNLALIANQNNLFYFLRGSSCNSTRHPQPSRSTSRYIFFCPLHPFVQADMLSACIEYKDILSAITTPPRPNVFRRIYYPPAWSIRIFYPQQIHQPSPREGFRVQADMLSACMEYEDMLSDKLRGAHPSPPKGREPERGSVFSNL